MGGCRSPGGVVACVRNMEKARMAGARRGER